MDEPIHIAIMLRVRKSHVAEFERAHADFARWLSSAKNPIFASVHCGMIKR
jgi:hypothetical protein